MRRNKKEWMLAGVLSVFCFAFSLAIYKDTERKTAEAAALRAENDALEAYAAAPAGERPELFCAGADALREAAEAVAMSGVRNPKAEEETPQEGEHGTIYCMKLSGACRFTQLLSLFDIIQGKKHWIAAELVRLERKDGMLYFEIELSAYQGKR